MLILCLSHFIATVLSTKTENKFPPAKTEIIYCSFFGLRLFRVTDQKAKSSQKLIKTIRILTQCKVEKILKGSLDSIPSPSPSVQIQNIGRESLFKV